MSVEAKRRGRKMAEAGYPVQGEPWRRHFHAIIPQELDEWIRAQAKESDISLSEVAAEALEMWLQSRDAEC